MGSWSRTFTRKCGSGQLLSGCTSNDAAPLRLIFSTNFVDICSVRVSPLILIPPCDFPKSVMQLFESRVTVCVCHALGFWAESSKLGCIAATTPFAPSNQAYPNTGIEFM